MAVDTPDAGFAAAEKSFCWECKRSHADPALCPMDARAGSARAADAAGPGETLRASGIDAAGCESFAGFAAGHRKVPDGGTKASSETGAGIPALAPFTGSALERCRAGTTKVHNFTAAFQCRGYSLRYVRQRHYATQRKRYRPLALRAGCGFRRRAATEGKLLQSAAGDLLSRPRRRRGDPASSHADAGRRGQPGRRSEE